MDCSAPAFEDDNTRIAAVMPDPALGDQCPHCGRPYDTAEEPSGPFDPQAFLDALVTQTRTPGEIGERVLCLSYLLNRTAPESVPTGPKTLRQLADSIGVSHVAAARRVNKLQADFIEHLAHCLNRPPHSCE